MISTLFLGDFSESGSLSYEFGIPSLIVLLIFQKFANLEACQFTTDIVLDLDRIKEFKAGDGLFDKSPELEVIYQVHFSIVR